MKVLKIIIINFILLVALLYTANYIDYLRENAHEHGMSIWGLSNLHDDEYFPISYKLKNFEDFYNERKDKMFRPVEGTEYTEKVPLVILGCSFAFGHVLPNNEVLSARIAEKNHRKVYNFAFPGWGVQQIYYLLKNNNVLQNVEQEGEGQQYLVYWYISDHLRRMYNEIMDIAATQYNLVYREQDGELYPREFKHPYLDANYIIKGIRFKSIVKQFEQIPEEEKYRFFNFHLQKIMAEKQKLFPNAQFILMSSSEQFPPEETKALNDMGIRVMYTQEMTGVDMENDPEWTYDIHPNAAAVELLSDALIKELNL